MPSASTRRYEVIIPLAAEAHHVVPLSNTADISASVAKRVTLHIALADTIDISDTRRVGIKHGVADTVNISDTTAVKRALHAAPADTIDISDATAKHVTLHKAISDTADISDVAVGQVGGGGTHHVVDVSDTVNISESVTTQVSLHVAPARTTGLLQLLDDSERTFEVDTGAWRLDNGTARSTTSPQTGTWSLLSNVASAGTNVARIRKRIIGGKLYSTNFSYKRVGSGTGHFRAGLTFYASDGSETPETGTALTTYSQLESPGSNTSTDGIFSVSADATAYWVDLWFQFDADASADLQFNLDSMSMSGPQYNYVQISDSVAGGRVAHGVADTININGSVAIQRLSADEQDFENGSGNWDLSSGAARSNVTPIAGTWSLLGANTGPDTLVTFMRIPALPSSTVSYTAKYKRSGSGSGQMDIAAIPFDSAGSSTFGTGNQLDYNANRVTPDGTIRTSTLNFTTPPGTAWVDLYFAYAPGSVNLQVILDTISFAETATGFVKTGVTLHVALSNTIDISDSVAAQVSSGGAHHVVPLSDTVNISDSVAKAVHLIRALSDTVDISDAVAKRVTLRKGLAETVNISETVATRLGLKPALADTVAISDTVAKRITLHPAVADTVAISETVGRRIQLIRALADTDDISDTVFVSVQSHNIIANISDAIQISDSVAKRVTLRKGLADAITISDTVTVVRGVRALLSDSVPISDAVTIRVVLRKGLADTVNISDVVTKAVTLHKALADTINISDVVTRRVTLHPAIADSVPISDLVAVRMVLRKALADTIQISDTVHVGRAIHPLINSVPISAVVTLLLFLRGTLLDTADIDDFVVAVFSPSSRAARIGRMTSMSPQIVRRGKESEVPMNPSIVRRGS